MNKIGIVGTGMVGSSYAYSLVNQLLVDEIVLLDINAELAEAQARDIVHGTSFLSRQTKVTSGGYSDLKDCDIICITSGVAQKPGETRLDLVDNNTKIMESIVTSIMATGFDGILLIASNPVDVMTYVAQKVSGLPHHRVIGSGTTLDTSRFRQNLSEYLGYNSSQIQANIVGEHGDSSVPVWSTARIANKPILDIVASPDNNFTTNGLQLCYEQARDAAYSIIEAKGSTYFGIGVSLAAITKAIIYDEHIVLNVSNWVENEYRLGDLGGVYIPVPAVVTRDGIKEIHESYILDEEYEGLYNSAKTIKEYCDKTGK